MNSPAIFSCFKLHEIVIINVTVTLFGFLLNESITLVSEIFFNE
jgi:hypothetical protein